MANGKNEATRPKDDRVSFCRNGQSELLHTYSGDARGVDRLDGAYPDLVPYAGTVGIE
jgi:hypothetical protein